LSTTRRVLPVPGDDAVRANPQEEQNASLSARAAPQRAQEVVGSITYENECVGATATKRLLIHDVCVAHAENPSFVEPCRGGLR
jgi:hypothetical protein